MRTPLRVLGATLALTACGAQSSGPPAVAYGGTLSVGSPQTHRFRTHCGIEWLGRFNDIDWRAETPLPPGQPDVPASWVRHVDSSERVVLRIELVDPQRVTARPVDGADASVVAFVPTSEPAPGCD